MIRAKTSLIFNVQDGKMLSCRRWFISIMVFNFNAVMLSLFALGAWGASGENAANLAYIPQGMVQQGAIQIQQNELTDWLEAKRVKYSKFKLSYPTEGIIHAKGFVPLKKGMVRVNVLEINRALNPNLDIKPQTASNYLNSRVKIRAIANRANSIIAINGGYFKPQTGVPLGALVIDGELLTGPIYNRAALSFNKDGTYSTGKTNFTFALKNKKINFKIDNINQPRMLSTYALLYTDKWGKNSPPPPKYGALATIENGVVKGIYKAPVEIPKNGYVVSAPAEILENLRGQKNLNLEINYPKHFNNVEHMISGGPFLVKDGEIFIDTGEEKLNSIAGKNPRTMIGYTENNELILVTIDGREEASVGMSLYEGAKFMQKLGCKNAINLDGGSSSVMYVKGAITNKPPVDGGIPLSHTLNIGIKGEETLVKTVSR